MSDIDDLRDEVWHLRTDLRSRARSEANNIYSLTNTVAGIVPTLHDLAAAEMSIPADRYYIQLGAAQSTTHTSGWFSTSTVSLGNWDATDKRQYARFAAGSSMGQSGFPLMIYPLGPFGQATSFAPKNAVSTKVVIQARARFNANADYTIYGFGANNFGGAASFNNTANHFIQVDRNSGNWELGTCDGSTISQTTGGTADSSFHNFKVEWSASNVLLYVDDVLVITKTTNMPTKPLSPFALTNDATNTMDLVDYLVEWAA